MTHIALVDTSDGSGKSLEDTLGLSTAATSEAPASFAPTSVRGGISIAPSTLPLSPIPGTIAIDSNGNLKWWNGTVWVSAGLAP